MKHFSTPALLNDIVGALIQHFGPQAVRASVERAMQKSGKVPYAGTRKGSSSTHKRSTTPVTIALALLRERDASKYHLLEDFYFRLRRNTVLPDSQDIRYFAQLVGIKSIEGKSRKDIIPRLMNQLLDIPIERLTSAIKEAEGISDKQRQRGFSVLTDKLIGEK
jgi:hypothetical protein